SFQDTPPPQERFAQIFLHPASSVNRYSQSPHLSTLCAVGKLRMVLGSWAQGAALALAVIVVALGQFASPAWGATSAAQQLADKYSPIVMVRAQTDGICDASEEQYWPPTSVDTVLGNPRVKLFRRFGGTTQLIKRAPTARDLARLPEGVYLDLPGSPLSAGCKYARDFARMRRQGR